MDSVRSQLGMLSLITSQTDEVTRETGVNKIVWPLNFKKKYLGLKNWAKSLN